MLPLAVEVVLLLAAAAVVLFQGAAVWFAYQMPRLLPRPPNHSPRPRPRVAVVIAARNEEVDLPGTLDDLLVQDYPGLDIVVVDGGSTDRTREVAAARAPRVRLLAEPPLPAGWVGKNWACQTGADATAGDWILFLDADVRTDPTAVRVAVEWAEEEGAALASVGTKIEMAGFWERTVLPFYVQMVLTYFRTPRVNRPTSRTAMANGQFLLVRRADYARLGGHAAVRGYVLEDVALARVVRRAGLPLRVAWAPELARTRMYRDRAEMFEGILKNVHGTEYSPARLVGFLAGLVGLFLLPLGLLPLGVATGDVLLVGVGAFLVVALFAKHVGFARALGVPAVYGLLYPVAVAYYVRVVATSLVRGARGRPIVWKGREYARTP
jgi:chlorobactene glucosyltransferase